MIYAYTEQNDNGNYVDLNGVRYIVHLAARLHGKVRDCWKSYESKEAALEAMRLTAVPVPEEQLLTDYTDPAADLQQETTQP